jgi:hypothetical protein
MHTSLQDVIGNRFTPKQSLLPSHICSVILRSRALARRLEGWSGALVAYPSRLAEDGEHLRMTAVSVWLSASPAMRGYPN